MSELPGNVGSMIVQGNALRLPLPDGCVQCCVTSPPYWGLRSYGHYGMQTLWGDIGHFPLPRKHPERHWDRLRWRAAERGGIFCPKGCCWIGGLGLEPTPELFVAHMVAVFREVWRVLRPDGTCWVNLGDAYAHPTSGGGGAVDVRTDGRNTTPGDQVRGRMGGANTMAPGLKPKNLVGIPWKVAFALQADGWWLRSDIIWAKPSPMPESVTDRPTKSHEYLFLLSKSARYYYDSDAVREPVTEATLERDKYTRITNGKDGPYAVVHDHETPSNMLGRNRRSVWTIASVAFAGSHFATFPPKLVEPCILAGTSAKGCCPECGGPWERVVEREPMVIDRSGRGDALGKFGQTAASGTMVSPATSRTTGWRPSCTCPAHKPVPCLVLDPFSGAGTSGVVAEGLGRRFVGIELNHDYATMAKKRIERPHAKIRAERPNVLLPLFDATNGDIP
jgi:DNA modification methylase